MMKIQGIQIIGTQRSGSNLLRVILNQSDQLVSPHPAHLLTNFAPLLPYYHPLDVLSYKRLVDDAVDYIHVNPVDWGIRLDKEEIYRMATQFSLFELNKNIYEFLARQCGASHWCCKSMGNMYFSDELEKVSDGLKYIYLYRDGRDVALSFQKAIVGEKHAYHIAKQWHNDQQTCLKLRDRVPPERFFMLNYEQLITHPEQTIRQLCLFLGIAFQGTMLDYYTSDESKRTAEGGDMWTNLTKPVMQDNFNKFLREMPAEDIRVFESVAADSLVSLGYEPITAYEDLKQFTKEEIAIFSERNEQLKRTFQAKGDDVKKRLPQLDLIKRIKEAAVGVYE
ncbi:sulfotransferase family protein [Parapedobacter koreensis]|uniref:Sulfotransferase family protein n=1 Tax=Parapedobacter koreensis TaxID=332977 RepID=A0A1H7S633_9SPHI|nr:sulfotransferase [Parapedobacter koreensis]SEL67739.1 Sulfotransferase family protein [Parapedobacter koreensis]